MRHGSLAPDQIARIIEMRESGTDQARIAEALGISAATVSLRLKRHGWTPKPLEFHAEATFAAYCAGLFDGEGHVAIGSKSTPAGKWHVLKVSITNTCLEALDTVKAGCGAGWVYRKRGAVRNLHPEWLPCYAMEFQSQGAAAFLRMIAPYALVKKEQIKIALEYADDVMLRSLQFQAPLTAPEWALREEYRARLKAAR